VLGNEGQMDRGVVVGGGLIAASFLVAIMLNRSANDEVPPAKATRELPVPACEQIVKGPPGLSGVPDKVREDCERQLASPLKR
jgi:hypothetical protein